MRNSIAVAVVSSVGLMAPEVSFADPIYLTSTTRFVIVQNGSQQTLKEQHALDNAPFSATVSTSDGSNQAMASLTSTLSPQGVSASGVATVTGTSSGLLMAIAGEAVNSFS
jgi:hypothetical protein